MFLSNLAVTVLSAPDAFYMFLSARSFLVKAKEEMEWLSQISCFHYISQNNFTEQSAAIRGSLYSFAIGISALFTPL